jgi:hypothetical protein
MDDYEWRNLVERIARLQRVATLAAGVKAAHPAMYYADVVTQAFLFDSKIDSRDSKDHPDP